ncbi:hypothetical protein [Pedobacter namyangjuensis]|uniref:hypothetical protein n=1 Tax=Pedobacter namyangjuensis TaxID=600626 RepID=UPI000DE4E3F8|nr:hypothetical protein [Pedobacter namyangjuensis]
MEKFPFNAAGFIALQQQLYALPDQQLWAEAENIKNDFDGWMLARFLLTQNQVLFLNAIDSRAKELVAFEASFAIGNRLPVLLVKADPPAEGEEQGKIFWPKSTLTVAWGTNTAYQASGTLEINIYYQKLV